MLFVVLGWYKYKFVVIDLYYKCCVLYIYLEENGIYLNICMVILYELYVSVLLLVYVYVVYFYFYFNLVLL